MRDTVVFFTTQTSATASIWRILRTINASERTLRSLGHELFLNGPDSKFEWSEIEPQGYLIEANCRHDLGTAENIRAPRFIVNFRDPRDRICNEFMWRLIHPKSPDEPKEEIEARAAKLREEGIDNWIARMWPRGPLTETDFYASFLINVNKLAKKDVRILTYARLCVDFDSFIERCCAALDTRLTPPLKDALEIERTDNLGKNGEWIGNRWNGSDVMPGRYKRELKPETIRFLNEKYAPVLRDMARLDPDYADLYLEGIDPPARANLPPPAASLAIPVVRVSEASPTRPEGRETAAPSDGKGSHSCHTIVDRPDMRIDHLRGRIQSNALAFTFTPRLEHDVTKSGFGSQFLLSRGIDVIAVKSGLPLWYENLRPSDLAEIERWLSWTNRPYEQRLGYGSSMGAYAAIRFSRALRLDFVLGFSPLFDILGAWENRWKDDVEAIEAHRLKSGIVQNCSMMEEQFISPDCEYFLIYDPMTEDQVHIDHYARIIDKQHLHLTRVPFAGHPAIGFFNETALLKPFVSGMLDDGEWAALPAARRGVRTASPRYLANLAETLLNRRHMDWALSINNRLLTIDPDNAEAYMRACRIYHALGRIDDARAALDRALSFNHRYHNVFLAYQRKIFGPEAAEAGADARAHG